MENKTKIIPYGNMADIDDKTLERLVDHEREIYGYEGFGEYLFCANAECRRIQSIDEVYGVSDTDDGFVPLKTLEKDGAKKPDCPDCHSPTLLIFDPTYFKGYLASLFRGAYGALLLDAQGNVQGSNFVGKSKLLPAFRENIDYKKSFDWDEYRRRLSEIVGFGVKDETEVICSNRVSIAHPYRGGGTFSRLMGDTLNTHPENDALPSVGATRFDSPLYPILKPIGYQEIVADPFGSVAIGIAQLGIFREALNLNPGDFKIKYGPKRKKIIEWQKGLKKPEKKPKYYKGAELLDQFAREAKL